MRYKIYEELLPDLEKKLTRIGKKCSKHGNPFTYEKVGIEISEVTDEETGETAYYKFIIIEVEGTAKISDYECVAIIDNHDSGNIIRRINTDIDIPERFMHTENVCEHCDSKRKRNNLYIIHNVITDEFKQVGSSCLLLYTNGLNAEYVAAYIDGITELEKMNGCVSSSGKYYYPVEDILGYATEIIDKMGYFNSGSKLSTKQLIAYMLDRKCDINEKIRLINEELRRHNFFDITFKREDFWKENTEDKINSIINYYLNLPDNGEFIHNIQIMLREGYIEWKYIGFIAYLPEGYNKYIKNEANRAERDLTYKNAEYFGEIGKKYQNQELKNIKIVSSWCTPYGYKYLYNITLNGSILIWKSTKWYEPDDLNNFKSVSFIVRNHSEYNGVKQTEVSHCKFTR